MRAMVSLTCYGDDISWILHTGVGYRVEAPLKIFNIKKRINYKTQNSQITIQK